MATVIEAVRIANRAKVPVVLNPSPLRDGFPWGKCRLDTLIVNAGEAQAIFGLRPDDLPAGLAKWQRALAQRRIERLIITQGARPTVCISAAGFLESGYPRSQAGGYCRSGGCFCGRICGPSSWRRRPPERDSLCELRGRPGNAQTGSAGIHPGQVLTEKAVRRLSLQAPLIND